MRRLSGDRSLVTPRNDNANGCPGQRASTASICRRDEDLLHQCSHLKPGLHAGDGIQQRHSSAPNYGC
jgi:hypothetical protein